MKRIAVLGSTGSIGTSALGVAEAYPEHFEVVALAAGELATAAVERFGTRLLPVGGEYSALRRMSPTPSTRGPAATDQ